MLVGFCTGASQMPGAEAMMMGSKDFFEPFFKVAFFLSIAPWMYMLFLSQGAETQPITMAGLRSNIEDKKMYYYSAGVIAASLGGGFFILQPFFPPQWSFIGSVLCAAIVVDLLRMSYCRFQFRRTPEGLGEWFREVMMKAVKRWDEQWYAICCEIPFAMMVFYMKAGAYGSFRLFSNEIVRMSPQWLASLAKVEMFKIPSESEQSMLARYMHAEVMTTKRIKWMLLEACALGSYGGVEEASRLSGKLFVAFHHQHESLGFSLLKVLDSLSQKDLGRIEIKDIDLEILQTYGEVVKLLIEESMGRREIDSAAIMAVLRLFEDKLRVVLQREVPSDLYTLLLPLEEIAFMLEKRQYRSMPGMEAVDGELNRLLSFYGQTR